jgi:N-acetylneuraminic acid mutarotase
MKGMNNKILLILFLLSLTASSLILIKPVSSSEDDAKNAVENTWAEKAPMQQARADLGVAVVNGKIYAIGGLVLKYQDKTTIQSIDVATNEEYDSSTNTWSYKAPMPTPRDDFAIAVYQNKIYCIGGSTGITRERGQTLTSANEVYDPATNTWENRTGVPTMRTKATANVVDGKIYVMGGYPNTTLNEVYDPATDTWTEMPLSTDPFGPSVVYNDSIYVMWGKTRIYDPYTNNWSFGAQQPKETSYASVGITSGFMAPTRLYVISETENQVYDPQADNWTTGADIPTFRGGFAVAVVDDLIYVIGGITITYPLTIPTDAPAGSGGVATYYSTVEQHTPFGYGTVPPIVNLSFPRNGDFTASEVPLNITVNRAFEWMGYSLDGKANVTLTGNITLTGLSNCLHNLTVYAEDDFGNIGTSETITFRVSAPFSNSLIVAVSTISIIGVCVGTILYLKRKKN